ncbi:MAG: ATP phosphoribosyltransferase regulatory subunit [Candidatus Heimdallarchaeota archaeon]|nr:ATP phosphoribosyltransferase regulatory subunit [Candidatus Heimdallarchaeota archaeon]
MAFIKLRTPNGTRDYLPEEVNYCRTLEQTLRETFQKWAYQEIRTPTIEFVDLLSKNVGYKLFKQMFKFQDFSGEIIALRPEMTTPIARTVATNFIENEMPLRFYYIAKVFRYSRSYTKRGREFRQAGIELIGRPTLEADGEVLALAIAALKSLGIENPRIDIGHATLLKDLLKISGLSDEKQILLKNLLMNRDPCSLESFLRENQVPQQFNRILNQLMDCRKLAAINNIDTSEHPLISQHVYDLQALNQILVDYKLTDSVFFDFSLISKIDYYTGLIFEISIPSVGLVVGSGGRYDKLIGKFAEETLAATGFALELEKCSEALRILQPNFLKKERKKILISTSNFTEGIKLAEKYRAKGCSVALEVQEKEKTILERLAIQQQFDFIIFLPSTQQKEFTIFDVKSNSYQKQLAKEFNQMVRS